jgi:hypothetical protein
VKLGLRGGADIVRCASWVEGRRGREEGERRGGVKISNDPRDRPLF